MTPRATWILSCVLLACRPTPPKVTPTTATVEATGTRAGIAPPVATRAIGVDAFVALVAAPSDSGHCEPRPSGGEIPGTRSLLYAVGRRETNTRNVVVILDSTDTPTRYSDLRGDLRGPRDQTITPERPLGPRTMIALDLVRMIGILRNLVGDSTEVFRVQGAGILDAPSLGNPAAMIARIRQACGTE